jgi:hypothetical protein
MQNESMVSDWFGVQLYNSGRRVAGSEREIDGRFRVGHRLFCLLLLLADDFIATINNYRATPPSFSVRTRAANHFFRLHS